MNSFAWSSLKVAQLMKKNKIKGSIVFINSIYGVLGQDKNLYKGTNLKPNPVYSLIKSGLIGYAKNLASYYGEYGIRVNSIISGGIKGHVAGSKTNQKIKNSYKIIKIKHYLKGWVTLMIFLLRFYFYVLMRSSYITGTNLHVDGGWTAI